MQHKIGAGAFAKVYFDSKHAIKVYESDEKFDASKEIEILTRIKSNRKKFKQTYKVKKSSLITLKKWTYSPESEETKLFFKRYTCNLQEIIGEVTQELARIIFHQIMNGLAELQFSGIIHGDLKPENILVQMNNCGKDKMIKQIKKGTNIEQITVKIIDFNKSLLASTPIKPMDIQTLYYTPPEIILGCRDYNYSVDTWTAVCILYEMITKRHLFNIYHKETCLDLESNSDLDDNSDSENDSDSEDTDYEKFKFQHLAMLHMYSSMLGDLVIPDNAEFAKDYISNGKLIGAASNEKKIISTGSGGDIDKIFERTIHYDYNNRLSIDEYFSIYSGNN